MAVFLLPDFIADLQAHNDANFARRVLQKTIKPDGNFRQDADDHPYEGIDGAWIRYVSRQTTAYRVIFLRKGENIYLFRAGEHSIEDHLKKPAEGSIKAAVPVQLGESEVSSIAGAIISQQSYTTSVISQFKRNIPAAQIQQEIFSRRNLPHKDIWLVTPSVDPELFSPTKSFGKLLLEQAEDGASVVIITAPPKDMNIEWMEKLAERDIGIYLYPRLNSNLYCFVFDNNRRYETGLIESQKYSSLILVGSSGLTAAGMAVGNDRHNEELCYSAPENEVSFVEEYITELMLHGYELPDVRRLMARGQWQKLENIK